MTEREFAERLRYYAQWIEEVYGALPRDRAPGPPDRLLVEMREEAGRIPALGQALPGE